ncbi:VanZ family protein [Streptomyces sp. NPDC026665]|uniref:VanZ family protein n=1 Tax=Streptomyces sp. NPDC026665 TaxID=3154798 RepID=UPI0034064F33
MPYPLRDDLQRQAATPTPHGFEISIGESDLAMPFSYTGVYLTLALQGIIALLTAGLVLFLLARRLGTRYPLLMSLYGGSIFCTLVLTTTQAALLGFFLALVAGLVLFLIVRRLGARYSMPLSLCGGAIVFALVLTAASSGMGSDGAVACHMSSDLLDPFSSGEGQANVDLFVPVGLFGVLALRKVTIAAVSGALLSCVIEATQAIVPGLARSCDTSDLETNILGTLIGCAMGALWMLVMRQRNRDSLETDRSGADQPK